MSALGGAGFSRGRRAGAGIGHYLIVAALAPAVRCLLPVRRDVDAFVAEALRTAGMRPLPDYLPSSTIEIAGT